VLLVFAAVVTLLGENMNTIKKDTHTLLDTR